MGINQTTQVQFDVDWVPNRYEARVLYSASHVTVTIDSLTQTLIEGHFDGIADSANLNRSERNSGIRIQLVGGTFSVPRDGPIGVLSGVPW